MTIAENIDRVIHDAIADNQVVGAVVVVMLDGKPVAGRAAGLADREASRPMSGDTIFRLASVSKPIVAAAALALIDKGALRFDHRVADWLPDFRPKAIDGTSPDLTIRQLLTHTAGLGYPNGESDDPYTVLKVSGGIDQPGLSMAENLRRISTAPLFFTPGSAWRYGVATDVLGAIVAKVNGGTLGEAVGGLITGPLDMHDTSFTVTDAKRLATAYADGDSGPVLMGEPHRVAVGPGEGLVFSPSRVFRPDSFQSGGAGMVGTAPDFVRFLEAVRNGGHPILRGDTVDEALQNQVGALREELDPGVGFGLISAIVTDPARAAAPCARGTARWGGVYGHNWFIDRENKLSVASFTNTAVEGCMGQFRDRIVEAVYA